MWYSVKVNRVSAPVGGGAAHEGTMKLNASEHPARGNETRYRSRRIAGGLTTGAALALGVLLSGFMNSSAAPPPAAPGAPLAPFSESLPGSVVKMPMIPIPGGTVKI